MLHSGDTLGQAGDGGDGLRRGQQRDMETINNKSIKLESFFTLIYTK